MKDLRPELKAYAISKLLEGDHEQEDEYGFLENEESHDDFDPDDFGTDDFEDFETDDFEDFETDDWDK